MANQTRRRARSAGEKGWWRSHRWLVLRRISQFMVLGMFLSGPWLGFWFCMATTAVVCCSIPSR